MNTSIPTSSTPRQSHMTNVTLVSVTLLRPAHTTPILRYSCKCNYLGGGGQRLEVGV